jgi:hypothetical protein
MNYKTIFLFSIKVLIIFLLCTCCTSKADAEKTVFYRAINKNDTALLNIHIDEAGFYGQYEIRYGGSGKDSGDVKGTIKHDTLSGDFYYRPYGGGRRKRVPFAALRSHGKLFLGSGAIGDYMNIPHYIPPVKYNNPKFIFEPVNDSVK